MQWSKYSENLFDRFENSDDNITVQACPGAGKTTNIKQLWSLDDKPTVYLVFNKHNQLEAQAKMRAKPSSDVLTINGCGHRILLNNYGSKLKLDNKKVYTIINDMNLFSRSDKNKFEKSGDLFKTVSMAKSFCINQELDYASFDNMCSLYDLSQYEGIYEDTLAVLQASDSMRTYIDFADQIRFPALYDLHMPSYHNVLVDESQDVSPVQALMLQKMQAQRYVFVGDRHQSIYGFRGAMSDSMDYLAQVFHCVELPLSITYRCAKSVVKEAYSIFPDIESWEESPKGTVRTSIPDKESYDKDSIVLCRLNNPLIQLAFALLKQDVPCHVRGRDIGEGLVKLINKQQCSTVRNLIDNLNQWYETESYKARAKDNEVQLQRIQDKFDSVMLFINRCSLTDHPDVVIESINNLFSQGKGVCLSTVHKAKGLEADKAFILQHSLMPLRFKNQQQWQYEQELNIKYVAVTRAKNDLVYM